MPRRARQMFSNVLTVAVVVGGVWLCIAHTWIVIVALIGLYAVGTIVCLIAALTSPPKSEPTDPNSALVAFVVGALFGWWLGGGDDGGC